MKLLVLAAFIAVVSSGHLSEQQPGNQQEFPWQTGRQYRYDVNSHTLSRLHEGASSGSAFKAQFVIRVKSPGRLQAKLEDPQHAPFHQQLPNNMALPDDLKYNPVQNLDKAFEIVVEGGRVQSINLPSTFSVSNENLLKGLISALQVDLSTHRQVPNPQNNYDKERQQGLFRKIETDVTGDCETLYSVSPVAAEWRRELPKFTSEEDPMEVTKSRNYGHCHHRVAYHFGVPEGAEWTGTAHKHNEKQFISHGSVSRILVGKQGPIYKAETTSSVHVHPHVYGKQKAEVHSYIKLTLHSVEQDNAPEWQKPEASRKVKTLLYAMTTKQVAIHDQSSATSQSSEESHEHIRVQYEESQSAVRRSNIQESDENMHFRDSRQSSSSSDSSSAYINDDTPTLDEPAYAAMYLNSQSQGDKKQTPMNVQKLLLETAQQLNNPNNMPKADFFGKFAILVRIIASMGTEQLTQTSRSIEVGKASNNNVKADMWMIYRDAVVQAGTPPAFQQIKTWIKTRKIENEEAAQVISVLVKTLRYPTKEIMTQFFDLAMSPEVQEQRLLNSSALIAATKFIRMGQVNNETAQSYYPTQMYGRLARKHDRFVLDDILPRLSEKLKKAVEKDERSKGRVYIEAIGTVGHPEILNVFAPYLEGCSQVSTYLRVQMISELRSLVVQNNKNARAVLYRILVNTAEPYEVRVAAALNLFRANPTMEMMQVMAQMTNDDPSIHVRAVLKNGIETAANLQDPRYWHLSRSAQAVKDMVTSENLGVRYSSAVFFDNYDNNGSDDDQNFHLTTSIGSEDSIVPKKQSLTWRYRIGGWAAENTVGFSFSSVQDFADYIKQMIIEPRKSDAKQKYSAKKLSEMLNIKRDPQEPLESSFYINAFDQERFFAFDEGDLNNLVQDARQYLKELEKGVDVHYTKVFNAKQVSVMFPLATGVPFIYRFKKPILIHIQGKSNGKIDNDKKNPQDLSANIATELQFTVARNIDGKVGFMDTLSNQLASVGVVKKYQVNIPLKMSMEMKSGEHKIRVEPLRPDQDTTIAHYSVWPYSAKQKKDSLTPTSQDPSTKLVERTKKVSSTDVKFGQQIGSIFQLQGYSYSKSYRHFDNPIQALTNIGEVLALRDIALTHYNFRYLGKQSKNKAVTFTAVYDEYHNQKQSGELGQAEKINDVTVNSGERRQEMAKRVSSGINIAKARVLDLSATFEGQQNEEYVLTAALANSPVDPKTQAAVFLGKKSAQHGNSQINVVAKVQKPEISPLNFLEALKKDIKTTYEVDVKFGQNGNINIKGNAERSQLYTEQLKQQPGRQCEQEIEKDNQLQSACYEMLVKAHAPDVMKAFVSYKNISPATLYWMSQAYGMMKQQNQNIEGFPIKKVADGKLELGAEVSYLANSMRFEMISPKGVLHINNIPIPDFAPYLMSSYAPFGTWGGYEHFVNFETDSRYQPFCTVDGTKVKTFSSRSYEYVLSSSWHVVMQQEDSQERGKWDELAILSRRPSKEEQEVYISLKTPTGMDLEINIPPSAAKNKADVNVKTNGQKITVGDIITYWDNAAEAPLLQYFSHHDDVLILNIQDGRLRVLFDGLRLVVSTSEYRKTTRGICGQNTGEPRDDYKTPKGLVDQPEYYGASFALDDENSDPLTQKLSKEAEKVAYQPKTKCTVIFPADKEWKQAAEEKSEQYGSQNVYRTRSYQKSSRTQCKVQQQVQYHENQAEICITTRPLGSCQSHCLGENYKVQSAQVVCQPKTDQQFQAYRDQIRQGQNPQVTGIPKIEQYRVPTTCTV